MGGEHVVIHTFVAEQSNKMVSDWCRHQRLDNLLLLAPAQQSIIP
jgi:hypothetical protein